MIGWFARHPTAANLLLVLIAAIGIMAAPALKRETFPDFRPTEAEINVVYRGASAAEVEDAICRRIWDAVEAVEYLEELTCTAQDNAGRAVATMAPGGEAGRFVNDLRTEVTAVDDFPEGTDPPVVRQLHRTDRVVSVAVAGDLPDPALDRYTAGLRDRLAASLLEAFWVLPHHLSHGLKSANRPASGARAWFERGFTRVRDRGLGRFVDGAIEWRYLVAGATLAALIVTVALMRGGYVQREALPDIEGDVLEAQILMPQGTPLARTEEVAAHVAGALSTVNAQLRKDQPNEADLVQSVQVLYGQNVTAGESGAHVATVSADLLESERRATTLDGLIAAWRAEIGGVPGAIAITLTEPGMGPQGRAVEIRLIGEDLGRLERAGNRVIAGLETYAGVYNAMHDLRPGRPELRLSLAEGAAGLGLSAADIAAQIGTAYLGAIVTTVQEGDIAHEIEVQQAMADRDSRDDLSVFEVLLPDGTRVPLSTVARIEEARGWGRITHVDGLRTLTVQADVDGRIGNADAIVSDLTGGFLPDLAREVPGLTFEIGGQNANSAETVGSILRGFLIGLVGIYVVLSFQFRSYLEPVIVMLTIPLALVGVVLGHMAMGYNISMPSIMGAASLAGIVVNNAILLIQVVKQRIAEGDSGMQAAGQASRDRFRPIVVSVTTTMMGMVPLLAETSTQAQTVKPLVISVVFGLFSATLLVLIVLPAFYTILDDMGLTARKRQGEAGQGDLPA